MVEQSLPPSSIIQLVAGTVSASCNTVGSHEGLFTSNISKEGPEVLSVFDYTST